MSSELVRIVRFVIVGVFAAGTDFVGYFALTGAFPALPTFVAKPLSFACGALVSFLGHRAFVFAASHTQAHKQAPGFVALYGATFVLNTAANELFRLLVLLAWPAAADYAIAGRRADLFIAWFAATVLSTAANYFGMRFVVFRAPPPSPAASAGS